MEYIEFPYLESEHEIRSLLGGKYGSSWVWALANSGLCGDGGSVEGVDDHTGKTDESSDNDCDGEYSTSDCSIFDIFFVSQHIGGIKEIGCFYNAFYFF